MARNQHIKKAFEAMKALGIEEKQIKPVLKDLLAVYDKNWELIAEDNYRVLADAIFEAQDAQPQPVIQETKGKQKKADDAEGSNVSEVNRGKKKAFEPVEEDEDASVEPERPLKRLRRRGEGGSGLALSQSTSPCSGSPTLKEHTTHVEENAPILLPFHPLPTGNDPDARALTVPKHEPFPDTPFSSIQPDSLAGGNSSVPMLEMEITNGQVDEQASETVDTVDGTTNVPPTTIEKFSDQQLAATVGESSELELASSASGEVKINLSFAPATGGSNLHLPSMEQLRRAMEEKCLRSYKILDPNFSVLGFLNDICSCYVDLATKTTNTANQPPENLPFVTANLDVSKKSAARMAFTSEGSNDQMRELANGAVGDSGSNDQMREVENGAVGDSGSNDQMRDVENGLVGDSGGNDQMGDVENGAVGNSGGNDQMGDVENGAVGNSGGNDQMHDVENGAVGNSGGNDQMHDVENGAVDESMGLVVVPECHASADDYRMLSSFSDITLGEEAVEIPWVNEVNQKVPPSFRYIPQSLVYLDAVVKFSLGSISNDQCCSSCVKDCLAPSMACGCVTTLDGFAAYTPDGLLHKDFLEECISEARDVRKHVLQYCKECPLEKVKNEEILEPCKGHLKRKVIKECWNKCGCSKKCGNRVVQQGINKKLQVFFTTDERGWGLRTLEKLPKGAFVCEFAGEILTIPELCQRSCEKVTCPVILDAHWGSEDVSGDDKALCLDGTLYGNISRFINHRCSDANLIEIPVHVESTGLHYYHLAFFTTREVNAMEELNWDYGVEFNDYVYPTIPFHCRCGSEFCRNIKKISKSKKVKNRA